MAVHIPWDRVDDWPGLAAYAEEQGVRIGAVNPNLFGEDDYRLGSRSAIRTPLSVAARSTIASSASRSPARSSRRSSASGSPTARTIRDRIDLRGRYERLTSGLEELYAALPAGMRLLVEYKFFEPAFYTTDLPDWGTAALVCRRLGPQAQVLVDTGHHAQGTNVEQIVALLLAEGLLGGFHFNNRKYADDDLMVGSIDPFELFRIMRELVARADPAIAETADDVALMIDQSHNVEGKIEAMIQSVMNIQTAYAKALLVDADADSPTRRPRATCSDAHRIYLDAFETDVRPVLARHRGGLGLDPDPVEAFRTGGFEKRLAEERGTTSVESAYEAT